MTCRQGFSLPGFLSLIRIGEPPDLVGFDAPGDSVPWRRKSRHPHRVCLADFRLCRVCQAVQHPLAQFTDDLGYLPVQCRAIEILQHAELADGKQ